MTEFDFDELDKAVNDLMATAAPKGRTPGDDLADKVLTIPASQSPAPAPVVPATTSTTSAVQQPSPAIKRRGQFMDIVHPSQDMNPKPKAPSRQGVTIQPDVSLAASSPVSEPIVTTPVPESEGVATAPENTPVAMPDPIDMIQQPTAPATAGASEASVASEQVAPEVEPLSSPFLADAKVEKRPLGSPAVASTPEDGVASNETSVQSTTLPEELTGDVMALEAQDLSSHPTSVPAQEVSPAPVTESASAPVVQSVEPAASAGPVSITQQYTEQPSSTPQTTTPMYDTATYHQAVSGEKPAKKASPILWIIWLVVVLLIGVAGGAAYFYFTR